MSILQTIKPLKNPDLTGFVRVLVAGQQVGWTKRDFAKQLADFDATWNFTGDTLILSDQFQDFDSRTQAIDDTFMEMSAKALLSAMPDYSAFGGIDWYGASPGFAMAPLCAVKRFYAPYLGIRNDAVMLNAYRGDRYWVAIRSQFVHDAPGKLDLIAAGAVDYRHDVWQTLLEEAETEAGLEEKDFTNLKKAGVLRVYYLTTQGFLREENFHIFDLEIGDDVVLKTRLPIEVEGFQLLSAAEIIAALEKGDVFKYQQNLTVTDFMIRHGLLNETHLEYAALKKFLSEDRKLEEFVR
jgi:hypothetical protein